MATIQEYVNNRHKYKVDMDYQRPVGSWSREDNQCFIDTILRNEPIPLFFFNFKTNEGRYYIVDGQQRLNAILTFYDNEYGLNKKFSEELNHGKTFNGNNPLSDEQREVFLNYHLNFKVMEDYRDEKIRMIFSRLQRGKPLTLGERINAFPGDVILHVREIAKDLFLQKSTGLTGERYGVFPDAARMIFYEKIGAKDFGSQALYRLLDEYKDIKIEDRDLQRTYRILNILCKIFPSEPGDYQFLNKHAWVIAVYTMVSDLDKKYGLYGKDRYIHDFIKNFHSKVYSEDIRQSNHNYQKFYDNVRGGWSEKIIALRRDILIQEFSKKYNLDEQDVNRNISEEDKIACFERAGHKCEDCGEKFKDHGEPEYHHIVMFASGGMSHIENIKVLCHVCHAKYRGKEEVQSVNERESDEVMS